MSATDTNLPIASTVAGTGNQRGYRTGAVNTLQAAGPLHMSASTTPVPGNNLPQDNNLQSQNVASEKRDVNAQEVSQAIQNLNDYAQNVSRQLQFSVDDVTGRTVIKVLDSETKETIRQIPSEEILNLARTLHDLDDDRGKLLEIRV